MRYMTRDKGKREEVVAEEDEVEEKRSGRENKVYLEQISGPNNAVVARGMRRGVSKI